MAPLFQSEPATNWGIQCPRMDRRDWCLLVLLTARFFVGTFNRMQSQQAKRGRPPKGEDHRKTDYLEIRVEVAEKQTFRDAAELAGLDLSTWVRERLRANAREELERASQPIAFLEKANADARSGSRG
jgi:uncharacterized protein (DUF1778 family)